MSIMHLQYVKDAATINYVRAAFERIDAEVSRTVYPEIVYAQRVPVDSSGDEWTQTVRFFSHGEYGAAKWVNGNSDDVPMAGTMRGSQIAPVHTAAIGYGWGLEEVNVAQRMGVSLQSEDAAAASLAAEQFSQRIAFVGSAEKGLTGLFNNTAVPTGTASLDWTDPAVTNAQVVAEFNAGIQAVMNQTNQSGRVTSVALSLTDFHALAGRYMVGATGEPTGTTLLQFLQRSSIASATQNGAPLEIWGDAALETAGAGGTRRKVFYHKDPRVLKMYAPMPHRFLGVFQPGPMRFEVPGIMRLGGVNVRRPNEMYYMDGNGA